MPYIFASHHTNTYVMRTLRTTLFLFLAIWAASNQRAAAQIDKFYDLEHDFENTYLTVEPFLMPYGFSLGEVDSVLATFTETRISGIYSLDEKMNITRGTKEMVARYASRNDEGERSFRTYVLETPLVAGKAAKYRITEPYRNDTTLRRKIGINTISGDVILRHQEILLNEGDSNLTVFTYLDSKLIKQESSSARRDDKSIDTYTYDQGKLSGFRQRYISQPGDTSLSSGVVTYKDDRQCFDITYSSGGKEILSYLLTDGAQVVVDGRYVTGSGEQGTVRVARTDDGSNPRRRSYLSKLEEDDSVETYAVTYYYTSAITDLREAPLVPVALRFANPVERGGGFTAADVPTGTSYRLFDAVGSEVATGPLVEGATVPWPAVLTAGAHFLMLEAPGFQARAYQVVVQ